MYKRQVWNREAHRRKLIRGRWSLVGGERDGPGSARRPVRGGAAGRLRRPSGAAGSVAWGLRRVVARQLPGAGPETLVGRCRPIAGGGGTVVEGGGPRGGGPRRAGPGETEAAEELLQLLGAAEVLLDTLGKAGEEVGCLLYTSCRKGGLNT